jgi:hypothetical protein
MESGRHIKKDSLIGWTKQAQISSAYRKPRQRLTNFPTTFEILLDTTPIFFLAKPEEDTVVWPFTQN